MLIDLESASNVAKCLRSLTSKGILRTEASAYVFEDFFWQVGSEVHPNVVLVFMNVMT
jgi:hypothetical protein